MDYFLAGHYGFHMDCTWNGAFHGPVHGESIWIPYGFHGISNEFQLQIHVLFHMESMEQSIWNPWNSPYGIHGTFHMDQSIWIPYMESLGI